MCLFEPLLAHSPDPSIPQEARSWCASSAREAVCSALRHSAPQIPQQGTALSPPVSPFSTGSIQGSPLSREFLQADGSANTRGTYLCCSKTLTFSFRHEVMFTIDWIHHKLLIITIISELIL